MKKKIYKVIKRLITVILLILLFIAFLGGKRWYDFNHTYSLEKKINYLSDPWYFSYGFPQKNVVVLKNNGMKIECYDMGFLKSNQTNIILSTKHFKYYLAHGVAWDVYNKKNMILDYNGNYCYSNDINKEGPLVDKKTVHLINAELNKKLDEVGHKLNLQIYNPF